MGQLEPLKLRSYFLKAALLTAALAVHMVC